MGVGVSSASFSGGKLQAASCKLQAGKLQACNCQASASCKLCKAASCKPASCSCKLQAAACKLSVAGLGRECKTISRHYSPTLQE